MSKNTSASIEKYFEKIRILRQAIEAGEKSGYLDDFDPIKHLESLKKSRLI